MRPLYYFRKARIYIQREGVIAFIKQAILVFKNKVFLYREFYIFSLNLNDVAEAEQFYTPKVKDYDFKVISAKKKLDELLERGFTVNFPYSTSVFNERLDSGQITFCIFIKKELAWSVWAVVNSNVEIDPPVKNIDYEEEAHLWYAFTAPQYRGLGMHTYGSFKSIKYLKEIGKSRIIFTTRKDNEPAIRTPKRFGSEIRGEGKYLRLFGLTFWKEKPIEKNL